jgi:hypothetical protein
VVRLDAKTRVIECPDGLQWIVQRLRMHDGDKPTWASQSFCRTRQALLRIAGNHPVLAALPEYFP